MQKNIANIFLGLLIFGLSSQAIHAAPVCPSPRDFGQATANYLRANGKYWVPLSHHAEMMFARADQGGFGRSCAIAGLQARKCSRHQERPPMFNNQCKYQYISLLGSHNKRSNWGGPIIIGLGDAP